MRCLDASFLIDLVRDVPEAVRKAESLATSGEHLSVAAPALAELLRRGEAAPMVDLLIAACTTMRKMVLVSRDVAFSRIPGVVVETY